MARTVVADTLTNELDALLSATKAGDMSVVVDRLVDNHGGSWRLLGDDDYNSSTVGTASSTIASWTERLTNAIDARLEDVAEQDMATASSSESPRVFVERKFGIKGGYLTNIDEASRNKVLEEVGIRTTLWDGDLQDTPTIDIRDTGTGISREEMPKSILSLHKGNKIRKWYLMGRYGQGGSTTFRFCDYTLIVSRRRRHPITDDVTFTVIRYQPATEGEKEGSYVYLVRAGDRLPFSVPAEGSGFDFGTLVRHIDYRFGKKLFLDFYGLIEARLFDPVLPFWLEERRSNPQTGERRSILGSRDRLEESDTIENDGKGELSVAMGPDGLWGNLKLRYWVFKEGTETKTKMTFIDVNDPIVITYLGQTHATLPRYVLNYDCQLPYLAKDLIVQIDCDELTDVGRRAIFTTTREFITDAGQKAFVDILSKTLPDELGDFESNRQMSFLSKGIAKEQDEMRKKLAEMINRIRPGSFQIPVGSGQTGRLRTHRRGRPRGRPPLPTKEFPTFLRIANKELQLKFSVTRNTWIGLESDAPDGFIQSGKAEIVLTDRTREFARIAATHTDFKGGRLYLSLALSGIFPNGTTFPCQIELRARTGQGMAEFGDSRDSVVVESRGGDRTKVPLDAPNIWAVLPDDPQYKKLEWNETSVAEVKEADSIDIFVSLGNQWYAGAIVNSKYTPGTIEVLKSKYVLHVALFSYLQHKDWKELVKKPPQNGNGSEKRVSEDLLDAIKVRSLDWAARTIATALTSEGAIDKEGGLS